MTLSDVASIIGIITGGWSLIYIFMVMTGKMAKMELKVDTLWGFLLSRGELELEKKGYGKRNSPIQLRDDVIDKVCNLKIAQDIHNLYGKLGLKLTDEQLAFEIEHAFRERIIKEICEVFHLDMGGCITLAVKIANGTLNRRKKDMGHTPERRKSEAT